MGIVFSVSNAVVRCRWICCKMWNLYFSIASKDIGVILASNDRNIERSIKKKPIRKIKSIARLVSVLKLHAYRTYQTRSRLSIINLSHKDEQANKLFYHTTRTSLDTVDILHDVLLTSNLSTDRGFTIGRSCIKHTRFPIVLYHETWTDLWRQGSAWNDT